MERIFEYLITEQEQTGNILNFLKARSYSQSLIAHLKRTPDGILKNGLHAGVREPLIKGDVLTIRLLEECSSASILPVVLPLSICYEDEDILVIDKPSGMPIHPSQGNYNNTLANALAFYYLKQDTPFVYRCINRLDRDTSGLLIVAKHQYSAAILGAALWENTIKREYLAVVTGTLTGSGSIQAPISRLSGSTIERQIDFQNGESAVTHYQALESKNGYTLTSIVLETGRTHQIRVHMKHLGYPLPGDFLYNPDCRHISRQALHSHKLSFFHPITKAPLHFTSELPSDMRFLISENTLHQ